MKIAIIYPVPFLDSVPIVQNLALLLAKEANIIELFIVDPKGRNNASSIQNKNLKINTFKRHKFLKKDRFNNFLPNNLLFLIWCYKKFNKVKFDHIIGVDPSGLAISGILSLFKSVNFSYLSLELILWSDKNRMYRGYKLLEAFFIKKTKKIIIQDELRQKLLESEYKLDKKKFLLFPNSPIGNATIRKSTWLHNKLNISSKTKIILYMGSWSEEFYNNWITELASKEIGECLIVVQTRMKLKINKNHYSNQIKFLTTPLKYSELTNLISSASVGLAFYDPDHSENIKYVGKSSGKMTHYLFNGVPIICNSLPYWEKSLKKYKSGECADDINKLYVTMLEIINNQEVYSKGAVKHFNKELKVKFSSLML